MCVPEGHISPRFGHKLHTILSVISSRQTSHRQGAEELLGLEEELEEELE